MTRPDRKTVSVTLVVVLLIAALLRGQDYLETQPLWLDETMLALGIGRLSFAGLTGPLPYEQSAPVLFLWSVKVVALIGGMSEHLLRLVPLLTGLAIPWLVWRTAKPLVGSDAALIAATLAAFSYPLIRYSAELKPYGVDAFVTVAVLALVLRVRAAPERSAAWWQLGVGGLAAIAGSFAAPFVLAGSWAALLLDPKVRTAGSGRKRLALLTLGWAAGFALLFLWLYLPHTRDRFMLAYWGNTFLDPAAPDFGLRLHRAAHTLTSALPSNPEWFSTKISLALLGVGLLLTGRRGGLPALAQTALPFGALIAGAVLAHYPVAVRLFLFLAPLVFIAFGTLIATLGRLVGLGETGAGVGGAVVVAVWGFLSLFARDPYANLLPRHRDPGERVAAEAGAEPVYVFAEGLPQWAYYSTDWRHPDFARLDRFALLGRPDGPATLNALVPEADSSERSLLVYRGPVRQEMVEPRAGTGYVEPLGLVGHPPDSAWVAAEVDRIIGVAKPHAWLYGASVRDLSTIAILTEILRRGIRVVTAINEPRSFGMRIEVPAAP